eukprot:TRINITY_DN46666_c0_g1_i1.p1 TRINITY_DN46666_c0_g1~~TRINITY_DN46666_c0_g1_i1.p1  ORF type:complete len:401 (-),score=36.43 TRINITY_DN46666_c0_g1_i1:218-1420(-)
MTLGSGSDSPPPNEVRSLLAQQKLTSGKAVLVGAVSCGLMFVGILMNSCKSSLFAWRSGSVSCEDVPAAIIEYNAQQLSPSTPAASFSYWNAMTYFHNIDAFNPQCPYNLDLELDANASIVKSSSRYRLLLGPEAQHLKDIDLPYANGLEWPLAAFQAVNRPLSYDLVLRALAKGAEDKDIPWWVTTNANGVLTVAAIIQHPLRALSEKAQRITVGDAGSGSGFLVAMMALMTPPDATAIGIEYDGDVAEHSQNYLRSKALFDGNYVGGASRARDVAQKIRVYKGDALSMTVQRLKDCETRGPWRCDESEMQVPEEVFDLLNVGFGLASPFPKRLLKVIRPGGYMLVPTCYSQDATHPGYCNEFLTLYQKLHTGKVVRVMSVHDDHDIPRIEGRFVDASA